MRKWNIELESLKMEKKVHNMKAWLTKKNLLSLISIFLLLLVCVFAIHSCAKVEAGYVGVRVNLLGGNKGVDSEVLGVGRYWIGYICSLPSNKPLHGRVKEIKMAHFNSSPEKGSL